jgi:hypothetical protein
MRVFSKDFEPVADVVGVVFPDLRGDAEVGTEERRAQFCDQLFAGISGIAETLPAEITVETGFVTRVVRELMQGGRIKTFLVLERLERRKVDLVAGRGIIRLIAAKMDGGAGGGDKLVRVRETKVTSRSLILRPPSFRQSLKEVTFAITSSQKTGPSNT